MVSVCLPSDVLLQHLPSYLGFSYLGCGVSLHGWSRKAQPLLFTLDKGHLLTAALPLLHGISSGRHPWPWEQGGSFQPPPLALEAGWFLWAVPGSSQPGTFGCCPWPQMGVTPLGCRPSGMKSSKLLPLTSDMGYFLSAALSVPVKESTCNARDHSGMT